MGNYDWKLEEPDPQDRDSLEPPEVDEAGDAGDERQQMDEEDPHDGATRALRRWQAERYYRNMWDR